MRTLIGIMVLAGLSASARAQTFTYGNPDDVKEVKAVDWSATAEAGLLLTTGNARTTTATAAAKAQRLSEKNKLAVEVGLAYARSTVLVAADANADGFIGPTEITDTTSTTANAWHGLARYDRFLSPLNSVYVAALAAADRPAGKQLDAGGQLGYSRYLVKKDTRTVVVEAGYDFTYQDPVTGDGVAIHSLRAFVGYKGTIREKSSVEASVEALGNLNTLDTAPTKASAFDDTRVNAAVALTSKITTDISLSVSVAAKYDHHPSARAPFAVPYEAGFTPVAEKLDTMTKVSLIVSLF